MTPEAGSPPSGRVPPWLQTTAAFGWRLLVVAAVIGLAAATIAHLRVIIIPLLLALMLAAALGPPAMWLRQRGLPPLLATWVVMLVALLLIGGIGWLLVPRVVGGLGDVGSAAVASYEDVRSWLTEGPLGVSPGTVNDFESNVVQRANTFARTGLTAQAAQIVEIVTAGFLTLVVAFFYVKDGPQFRDAIVRLFPRDHRDRARQTLRTGWNVLQRYLLAVVVVGLVDAVLIGAGLALIGVPLVVALAALTFLAAFFPLVGAFFAGGVAALIALAAGGVTDALLVVGLTVVIQQLDGDVVAPMVYSRAVDLHPLAILLALTGGAVVAGVVGAVLAVPILAVTTAMIHEWRNAAPKVETQEPSVEHSG